MRPFSFLAFGLLAAQAAAGQSSPGAPPSQWGWGGRGALGYSTGSYRNSNARGEDTFRYPSAAAGLVLTRYVAKPRASIGLELLVESNQVRVTFQRATPSPVYHPQTVHQGRLFVPLYLRTGTPASVFHGLLGAGPVLALFRSAADAAYSTRAAELALLLGAEVRVAPWHRCETTLGLRLRAPLTPSYDYSYPVYYTNSQGGHVTAEGRDVGFSSWVGFTLATTFYPAAAQ